MMPITKALSAQKYVQQGCPENRAVVRIGLLTNGGQCYSQHTMFLPGRWDPSRMVGCPGEACVRGRTRVCWVILNEHTHRNVKGSGQLRQNAELGTRPLIRL
jgi:hypothetical protein